MAKHTRATTTLTAAATKLFPSSVQQIADGRPFASLPPGRPAHAVGLAACARPARDVRGLLIARRGLVPRARTSVPLSAQTSSQSEGAAFDEIRHLVRRVAQFRFHEASAVSPGANSGPESSALGRRAR
jgi:hypothetical protein